MADVNEAGNRTNSGQMSGRSVHGRTNLGLLLPFLGAVFLVLLVGLLVLDGALLRANRDQAIADAQTAELLTESFVATQIALVEQIAAVASGYPALKDSLLLKNFV